LRNTYDRPTRLIGALLDHRQMARARACFRRLRPDLIHVNQQVAEDGLDLLLAAKQSGIPYVSTIHISHSAQALGAKFGVIRDTVANMALRHIDATHILAAEQAKREMRERLDLRSPGNQLRLVYYGVCEEPADRDDNARLQVREEWGVAPEEVVIGCVGRLVAQKNPLFLLDVIAGIRSKRMQVRLVWVGDGPLKGAFMDQATTIGLAQFVTVDGWRNDARRRMSGMDIFVMPSRFEGLPLALLESMWAGVPCCVSDVSGIPEAVEHGVNGFVCALDDLDEWTAALTRLVGDPKMRRCMGQRALELARSRFSIRRMAEETQAVYETVLSRRSN